MQRAARTSSLPAVDAEALRGLHLLVVDDSPDNQHIVRVLLQRLGASVELSDNGQRALETIAARPDAFDAVFMDMQMPVLDGYRATKALREQGLRVPVIALTAYGLHDDRQRCLDAGCQAYLTKPMTANELGCAVLTVLGRKCCAGPSLVEDARSDGMPAFDAQLDQLRLRFRQRLQRTLDRVQRAIQAGDAATVKAEAHKLAGTGASFGFDRLSTVSSACEQALTVGDLKAASEAVAVMVAEIAAIVDASPTADAQADR